MGGTKLTRPSYVGSGADETNRQGVIVSNYADRIDHLTDCANTLMARDYKGFGKQSMNAVITQKSTKRGTR
ncbi:MAG TPA: hypothetical protein DCW90_24180 [Lachnospiraceae bacterium]|nr:hypothetical protein [Lachnospiraceae bacterium]